MLVSMPNENSFFWLIDLSESTKCVMRTYYVILHSVCLCMHRVWSNKQMALVHSGWRHFNDNCVAQTACCRRHFMIHVIYIFAFVQCEWYKLIWRDQFENEWTEANERVCMSNEWWRFHNAKALLTTRREMTNFTTYTHTHGLSNEYILTGPVCVFSIFADIFFHSLNSVLNLNYE